MNKAQELLNLLGEGKPSEKETYLKIKDWDALALQGYAKRIGLGNDVISPIKKNSEALIDEIMGFLYDDNWVKVLMKQGVL
jgi:hypothetical protein|tara:strand:- start:1048 stop:1290 length:243 start_codon:yes stop_codon:yes gene_type:complete